MANKWEFKEGDVIGRLTILGRDYHSPYWGEIIKRKNTEKTFWAKSIGSITSVDVNAEMLFPSHGVPLRGRFKPYRAAAYKERGQGKLQKTNPKT